MNSIIFSRKTTFVRYGGRHFRFSVYSVFSKKNSIGIGFGKASNFSDAISKSFNNSKKESFEIKTKKNTFPFGARAKVCKTCIKIIPSREDTGIIAGDLIRIIFKNTKIKNFYSKVLGSKNKVNTIKAIILILKNFKVLKKKK
ncbi:SSU ribosomal protein S5p (S2e) [Candidatus Vidania fulgoroideae]|nr:SSU ribosomal protein S5p (S2e) [Candidatus Vidania fulgoroideae]